MQLPMRVEGYLVDSAALDALDRGKALPGEVIANSFRRWSPQRIHFPRIAREKLDAHFESYDPFENTDEEEQWVMRAAQGQLEDQIFSIVFGDGLARPRRVNMPDASPDAP